MIEMKYHDFRGIHLSRIPLELVDCEGANFSGCDLTSSLLSIASLMECDLQNANLQHARMHNTILMGRT